MTGIAPTELSRLAERVAHGDVPCLSIKQPYPHHIFHDGKDVEDRDWVTSYRGWFIVHAGVSTSELDMSDPDESNMPRGGVVGMARITACVGAMDSRWFHGKYGFVLADAFPLTLIPARGQLGFFKLPPDVLLATALAIRSRVSGAVTTPIGEKVAHVRVAGQTRDHDCHWPGCGAQVSPAKWGCLKHWRMLPKGLRDEIWRSYRPGQETDMRPSPAYLDVARRVQAWIAEKIGQDAQGRLI